MTKSRSMVIGPNKTTLKRAIDFLHVQMMIRQNDLRKSIDKTSPYCESEKLASERNRKKFEDVIYFLKQELEKRQ